MSFTFFFQIQDMYAAEEFEERIIFDFDLYKFYYITT